MCIFRLNYVKLKSFATNILPELTSLPQTTLIFADLLTASNRFTLPPPHFQAMAQVYSGIDYGLGQTNIDKDTGIRYGVIHNNKLASHARGDITSNGEDLDYTETIQDLTDQISSSLKSILADYDRTFDCKEAAESIVSDLDLNIESSGDCTRYLYEGENETFNLASDGDIFVTRSKYYTLCSYCSPCAPGAGYLENAGEVKAYCLGPEWFDKHNPMPYRCYYVENDCEVLETYLHVVENRSGHNYVMAIDGDDILCLETLVKKWIKQEYSGELELDGELTDTSGGNYYAAIHTDWGRLDSGIVWTSAGFYVKSTY